MCRRLRQEDIWCWCGLHSDTLFQKPKTNTTKTPAVNCKVQQESVYLWAVGEPTAYHRCLQLLLRVHKMSSTAASQGTQDVYNCLSGHTSTDSNTSCSNQRIILNELTSYFSIKVETHTGTVTVSCSSVNGKNASLGQADPATWHTLSNSLLALWRQAPLMVCTVAILVFKESRWSPLNLSRPWISHLGNKRIGINVSFSSSTYKDNSMIFFFFLDVIQSILSHNYLTSGQSFETK